MLFGNDAIVTVMQREAGEPMRERIGEMNAMRKELESDEPITPTRESDLRQKLTGEASHLAMIVRHAAAAMEAKTPAAPVQHEQPAAIGSPVRVLRRDSWFEQNTTVAKNQVAHRRLDTEERPTIRQGA